MVYFRCTQCDVKWTKLIDDGCPICASSCQVTDDIPSMNSIRDGEDAGPFAQSSQSETIIMRTKIGQTAKVPVASGFDGQHLSNHHEDNDDDDSDEQLSHQDLLEMEEHMDLVQMFKRLLSPTEITNTDLNDDNPALSQLGKPDLHSRLLHAPGVVKVPRRSSSSDIANEDIRLERQANISLTQDVESKPSGLKVIIKDKPLLLAKDQTSNNVQSTDKKKKKSKRSRTQKQNKPSAPATKAMAQLELPDPIPSPGMNNRGSGWNDVVGKGTTKAVRKMHNDTLKRINEREIINASSYLVRDNENEMPIRERAAIEVRVGMGSAKHDLRRVIPRSALE